MQKSFLSSASLASFLAPHLRERGHERARAKVRTRARARGLFCPSMSSLPRQGWTRCLHLQRPLCLPCGCCWPAPSISIDAILIPTWYCYNFRSLSRRLLMLHGRNALHQLPARFEDKPPESAYSPPQPRLSERQGAVRTEHRGIARIQFLSLETDVCQGSPSHNCYGGGGHRWRKITGSFQCSVMAASACPEPSSVTCC